MSVTKLVTGNTAVELNANPEANDEDSVGRTIGDFGKLLWRRKSAIIVIVVVTMGLTWLVLNQLTPRYSATVTIEIDPRTARIANLEAIMAGLPPADAQTIETQIRVISSRKIAERTIEKLELDRDPEFNVALRPDNRLKEWLGGFASDYGFLSRFSSRTGDMAAPAIIAERERARVVNDFLRRLRVAQDGRSRVIKVTFESNSPETSAKVANTVADFYIVAQLEAKFEATRRANAWLSDRIAALQQEVLRAERAIEEHRGKSGLLRGRLDVPLTGEQVSELNAQLVLERTRLAEAEARLRQIEQLKGTPQMIETAPEVLVSPLIRDLRTEEGRVQRALADMSESLGSRHPKMVSARAELQDIRNKIREEIDKIIQGVRNEVAIARARTTSLSSQLDKLKGTVAEMNQAQVEMRSLEREAEASRILLETLLARAKETSSQETFQQADANILSYAATPERPSFPRTGVFLAFAFFGALTGGIGFAFAMEQMDFGFRSREQVERYTRHPALGLVPILRGTSAIGKKPHDYILEKPTSAYAESIRSLHTSLLLSDIKKRPGIVLFSSAMPNEGKTATAVSLGRMLASLGQRVLLIDCDLRRPSAHEALRIQPGPGVVECLAGKKSFEEVIEKDPYTNLHLLRAGAPVPNAPNVLDSPPMHKMLNAFSKTYDLVLIDSAPIMALSDALFLSRLADKTVFVCRWGKTRRNTANLGLAQLREAGADIAGVLLTLVDSKGHAQYNFSDSGTYHGKLKEYYAA